MSEGISTILGIPRSTNNLKENGDIGEMNDQSTIGATSSSIFKKEYINSISDPDTPALTASSVSTLFNSSISERPR